MSLLLFAIVFLGGSETERAVWEWAESTKTRIEAEHRVLEVLVRAQKREKEGIDFLLLPARLVTLSLPDTSIDASKRYSFFIITLADGRTLLVEGISEELGQKLFTKEYDGKTMGLNKAAVALQLHQQGSVNAIYFPRRWMIKLGTAARRVLVPIKGGYKISGPSAEVLKNIIIYPLDVPKKEP